VGYAAGEGMKDGLVKGDLVAVYSQDFGFERSSVAVVEV